jgi:tetratricopeptide (TPR) repeat protein
VISWQRIAPYLFLTASVFAVYANVYENVLLFDDDLLIRLNTYLHSWDTFGHLLTASTTEGAHIAGGFYRPIQNILYFILFQLNGENVTLYHLLNVALHTANACLGYRLARRIGLDPRAALFGIIIWALHPLHTEAITYMSGTADPLSVIFMLGALNILFPEPTQRRVWQSIPLFALALLSKETAVVFPALVTITIYFMSEERWKLKTYQSTWPLWLITLVYLAWRVTSPDLDGPARYEHLYALPEFASLKFYAEDPWLRMLTFFSTLPAYARLLVWPVGLHMERAFPVTDLLLSPPVLLGIAMILLTTLQVACNRNERRPALSWGLLWFTAAHAPNTGLLFSMNSLFLEHWMYLPSLGLFLGMAQFSVETIRRFQNSLLKQAAIGTALITVTALSARTYDQNKIWHDPIVFYNNIFSYGVQSARAHNNLAIAYTNIHNIPMAIQEYRRAIMEGDTYAETHYNLALTLLALPDQKAQIPQIIKELKRSIEIEPRFYRSYDALAQLYAQSGDQEKAATYRQKAKQMFDGN